MIARNVGTVERLVRLMLAAGLATWIVTGTEFGITQAGATVAALALFWNSIFGRCYLWKWLRLSTCPLANRDCNATGDCSIENQSLANPSLADRDRTGSAFAPAGNQSRSAVNNGTSDQTGV